MVGGYSRVSSEIFIGDVFGSSGTGDSASVPGCAMSPIVSQRNASPEGARPFLGGIIRRAVDPRSSDPPCRPEGRPPRFWIVVSRPKVLAIVLAGGEGKRLMPLTADRAKPAVPFGGIYRLIDFALSNVVNSGYLKIVVLTQYKSHSLDRHITKTWRMSNLLGNYITPVPAQQRIDKNWFLGSADAIYQSLNLIHDEQPDIVVVVGADHVYRMDFSHMVAQHMETGTGVTVAAIRQPIALADQFGVIEVDGADPRRIKAFREKPTDAEGLPDSPEEVLASMGNYVFDADVLVDA